mmetsp:Transcript_5514/g.11335  ORF Transcript_5514/g.11335 Transcript_5514/m.11335 type:complete len:329 (-) Transcript_5514:1212-2198(-)
MLVGKLFNLGDSIVEFLGHLALGKRVFGTVGSLHNTRVRDIAAPHLLECRGNLSEGTAYTSSFNSEVQKVHGVVTRRGGLGKSSTLGKLVKSRLGLGLVTLSTKPCDTLNLGFADLGVINTEHLDTLHVLGHILVHTNNNILGTVDAGLLAGSRLLNAELRHTGVNGLGHATKLLNLINNLDGLIVEVGGEVLNHVRSTPRVSNVGHTSLLLDDELGVTSNTGRKDGGETKGLIKSVSVETLGTTKGGSHGLDGSTNDVVVRILLGERVSRGLTVSTQEPGLGVLSTHAVTHHVSPQFTSSTELGNLHVEIHADGKEETKTRGNLVNI